MIDTTTSRGIRQVADTQVASSFWVGLLILCWALRCLRDTLRIAREGLHFYVGLREFYERAVKEGDRSILEFAEGIKGEHHG